MLFALTGMGLAVTGGAIAFADAPQDNLDTQAEFINWSATHGCRPVRVYEPKSVDDIESIGTLNVGSVNLYLLSSQTTSSRKVQAAVYGIWR